MKLFCLIFMALLPALASAQAPVAGAPAQPGFFAKQGIKVLSYQKGAGGLNVWQVQRGLTKTVLYTTPDNKVLLSAVLWDAATGSNLSDAYITRDMVVAQADKAGLATAPAAIVDSGNYSPTKVSDAIKGISTLTGIKEGGAPIDKTLYIIFDPRCPYCHSVYKKTRQFVKDGGTIKWIPTTLLGNRSAGGMMVADMLQSRKPLRALDDAMLKQTPGTTAPTAATQKTIDENEAYFFAAFDKNKSAGAVGVPVAFFETKSGAPQMVSGIDDDALLKQILTDIKK